MSTLKSDGIVLSSEQETAVKKFRDWWRGKEGKTFYLAGYAGTGKSTVAKIMAEGKGRIGYAAPTHKAAAVLRSKGIAGAGTIHSFIYILEEPRREDFATDWEYEKALIAFLDSPEFALQPEDSLDEYDLIVVDECSMVDQKTLDDLEKFAPRILAMGDPGQLPPVGGPGAFTFREPDAILTQVHRQAEDNPILALATQVRLTGQYGAFDDIPIISAYDHNAVDWFLNNADQVVAGFNKTRREVNFRVRRLRGIDDFWPVPGDRMISQSGAIIHKRVDPSEVDLSSTLRGLGFEDDTQDGLFNGEEVVIEKVVRDKNNQVMEQPEFRSIGSQDFRFKSAYADIRKLDKPGVYMANCVTDWWKPDVSANPRKWRGFVHLDYAYAITAHKSQGSEWERVAIYDDGFAARNIEDRKKWLYTAVTRASKALAIIRSN
ncbi:ATP-dependent DNA helicase [Roseibium aggregatum]|uniref:Exonuclease V subunit alpha n=1 Tax=Roseibium aggregatum TaxID=187304 RepID=A0A0M6Y7N9_9HYPH|nr:AAA family ATPase [Roseibium aggregatum]CTQ45688.1 exonuclease V subunit alpha [Roseibium aggregatum]